MMELNFLCEKKILGRLKKRTIFALFCYENELVFPIYISNQRFENSMDLLLLTGDDKSHYVNIKRFDRFMFHKTKKYFCKNCLECFISKIVLKEHKKVCLGLMVQNL